MIHFVKNDGSPLDLDYTGTIHAKDNGNDTIAVCAGGTTFSDEMKKHPDVEMSDVQGTICNPLQWDDWTITMVVRDEVFLQKALAMAYSSLMICQHIIEMG